MGDATLAPHGPPPNHRLPGPPALAPPRRGVRESTADRRAGLPPDRAEEGGGARGEAARGDGRAAKAPGRVRAQVQEAADESGGAGRLQAGVPPALATQNLVLLRRARAAARHVAPAPLALRIVGPRLGFGALAGVLGLLALLLLRLGPLVLRRLVLLRLRILLLRLRDRLLRGLPVLRRGELRGGKREGGEGGNGPGFHAAFSWVPDR